MTNRQLLDWSREFLNKAYSGRDLKIENHLVFTLALMITGLLIGPHAQLFAIAMCVPWPVKLLSIVRRFERFVSDERVDVRVFFEPFVRAMQVCLGNETVYLIMDCTQAGPRCRTLVISMAYHGTVLPLIWKTVKGNKGHVTGEFQKALLVELNPQFRYHKRVIVLGDAEFSNEPVINWLRLVGWGFVFRFQYSYYVQTTPNDSLLPALEVQKNQQMQAGQVHHWAVEKYTKAHQIPDLTMTVHWETGADEPLYLISNLPANEEPHMVYEMRYWVETLFGNQKSRGFQLARTQMTTPEHIDRLILAMAIATCLALGLGTHLVVIGQTDQVDRADRRDLSLFQIGWRWLHRLLALDRLNDIKIEFRWDFELPPPGFHSAT